MTFRFRLLSPAGDDLGSFVASRPDWSEGDEIPLRPGERLRVVDTVYEGLEEDDMVCGLLVVERLQRDRAPDLERGRNSIVDP